MMAATKDVANNPQQLQSTVWRWQWWRMAVATTGDEDGADDW